MGCLFVNLGTLGNLLHISTNKIGIIIVSNPEVCCGKKGPIYSEAKLNREFVSYTELEVVRKPKEDAVRRRSLQENEHCAKRVLM